MLYTNNGFGILYLEQNWFHQEDKCLQICVRHLFFKFALNPNVNSELRCGVIVNETAHNQSPMSVDKNNCSYCLLMSDS